MSKKTKYLGSYSFRTVATDGSLCKTYCYVFSNGITHINQLRLSKQDSMSNYKKIYTKLGYNLFFKEFGLKLGSLFTIVNTTTSILNKNKVKQEDIV